MSIGSIQALNQPQIQASQTTPAAAVSSAEESGESQAERMSELASGSDEQNPAPLHAWQGASVNLQA